MVLRSSAERQRRVAAHRACERTLLIRENRLLKQAVVWVEQELRNLIARVERGLTHSASIARDAPQTKSESSPAYYRGQDDILDAAESIAASFDLSAVLDQIEKDLVVRTLSAAGGVQAEAARRMSVSRSALAYKLRKHGIQV